eukprot:3684109-Rhodomonas_salina.1
MAGRSIACARGGSSKVGHSRGSYYPFRRLLWAGGRPGSAISDVSTGQRTGTRTRTRTIGSHPPGSSIPKVGTGHCIRARREVGMYLSIGHRGGHASTGRFIVKA